ncbi:multisubstrate pseudouridine synthase 7-like [Salvia hispanica]|uniref:multisubstrate pseudouridine synthase 7-like n=1 Tax=Salvia hispanica TaxID=49212 RepID=UPI00200928D7|nr:multisubstrate pseudouridine synthase 7-like [Salvia hispanica]
MLRSQIAKSLKNIKPFRKTSSSLKPYSHRPEMSMNSVEESQVGILCYISQLPGFRGILKQRYSDFIVNEVGLDGNVVHLTTLDSPLEIAVEKKVEVADLQEKDYTNEIESFRVLAGDSDVEKLKKLIDQVVSGVINDDESIVLSPSSDKSHRTAVHNFFKERMKFLVTDTVDGPDSSSKCIRVRMNSGSNNGRGRNSRKRKNRDDKPYDSRGSDSSWPENLGKFLRFHLYKENKDTQEALGLLAKMLGTKPRSFGFAGTKDKRAVTTQRVTVFKQRASKLAALNEKLIGIKVGNFCHVNEGLVLGQLQGNRFTITLRSISAENEDIIRAAATSLGENGFINYFGLQRFGSSSIATHLIGAALLRGEWKGAVSMVLEPREGEKDATRQIREYYKESGDIEGTLRQLPRYLVAERSILQCFQKSPGNYLQALLAIPRTLRMMFVHSYQSYLWNHAASMRVQNYGMHQVVLGDLVYCKEEDNDKETLTSPLECEDDTGDDDTHFDCNLEDIPVADLSEEKNASVKVITEEDIAAESILLKILSFLYRNGISLTESAHNSNAAAKDARVSLAISEAYVDDGCDGVDTQSPKCPKITISGKLRKLPAKSREGVRRGRPCSKPTRLCRVPKMNGTFSVYRLDILHLFLVNRSPEEGPHGGRLPLRRLSIAQWRSN